jgi:hypothetical protein
VNEYEKCGNVRFREKKASPTMMNTWSYPPDGITKTPGATETVQEREMQYRLYLATAITLRVKQLRQEGGPTVAQAERLTTHLDQAEGTPLYRLSQADRQACPTRQLVEALAVLSFIPGGIAALGLHCQTSRDPVVSVPCIALM